MTDRTVALLVAAGQGSRAGGDIPKQFRPIGGKPVLIHAVDALARHPAIDSIVLVVGAGQEDDVRAMLGNRAVGAIVQGADSRRGSVRAGLEHIASTGGAARILVHDAARPAPSAATRPTRPGVARPCSRSCHPTSWNGRCVDGA